mgnify:CR=1 FL=1
MATTTIPYLSTEDIRGATEFTNYSEKFYVSNSSGWKDISATINSTSNTKLGSVLKLDNLILHNQTQSTNHYFTLRLRRGTTSAYLYRDVRVLHHELSLPLITSSNPIYFPYADGVTADQLILECQFRTIQNLSGSYGWSFITTSGVRTK